MVFDPLRLFLLSGLLLHKAIWEALRRRDRIEKATPALLLVKSAKLAALIGLCLQTVTPAVFPILPEPTTLRWPGGLLFAAGLALAVVARFQLGRQWSDIETASVRADHAIVEYGVYRFIRHPIYTGDLLLVAGLELALNCWLVLLVIPLALIVFLRAGREEEELAHLLPGYREYQSRTKRFVPFVI
jgi:protein-S-isoprenylcysteine O-methyltransferase Ste14